MDYKKNYFDYIGYVRTLSRTREKGKYERHHIIPKSLGGSDNSENLVLLTCREHYLAHYLLCKFTEGEAKKKMIWAFHRMCYSDYWNQRKITSSRLYEYIRKEYKDILFDEKFKQRASERAKNTQWVNNGLENKMVKNPSEFIQQGWKLGRLPFKNKNHRGKDKGTRKKVPKTYWIYNEISNKDKMVKWEEISAYEAKGWKRGRLRMKEYDHTTQLGKIRVYNSVTDIEKSIFESELSEYEKQGFKKGRREVSKETKEKMSKSQKLRRLSDD